MKPAKDRISYSGHMGGATNQICECYNMYNRPMKWSEGGLLTFLSTIHAMVANI